MSDEKFSPEILETLRALGREPPGPTFEEQVMEHRSSQLKAASHIVEAMIKMAENELKGLDVEDVVKAMMLSTSMISVLLGARKASYIQLCHASWMVAEAEAFKKMVKDLQFKQDEL